MKPSTGIALLQGGGQSRHILEIRLLILESGWARAVREAM